ncbi:universal stress protein [Streptomyces gobiensis]|uniref:universal stress protein n=1 Tax=Streptomyces gobiensis TaxID=2875706 RepID=UPI001E61FC36|nr:universal stress protein [Streptomyces gobiensis]UGY91325.1 universal stress protein [Streptomyces gobiensis]
MNGWQLTLLMVGVWVLSGLISITVLLLRQGYRHPLWFVWGIFLGPLTPAVLVERIEHHLRVIEIPRAGKARKGLTVLIGVDASPGSVHTVETARELLGPQTGRAILTCVVDYDTADTPTRGKAGRRVARAHDSLLEFADRLADLDPSIEVVAGHPATALLDLAEQEHADVIVVGHHPHRMGHLISGHVCKELVAHSPTPVLIAGLPKSGTADDQRRAEPGG